MAAEIFQSVRRDLPSADILFGSTAGMRKVRWDIERAFCDDSPVLIEGESGTGKEVIGKFLHAGSNRSGGPFLPLNCAAVSTEVLRAEIFGHAHHGAKNLPTTASESTGLASGGTLFLDQIGDMNCDLLETLMQALETGTYRHLDGSEDLRVNARCVCASSIELESGLWKRVCNERLLRLFSRHRIRLLPLRERMEDIPQLCEHLLKRFASDFGRPVPRFNPKVLEAFEHWNWPGNIRELENWIARIVIFGAEEAIGLEFSRQFLAFEGVAARGHHGTSLRIGRTRRTRKDRRSY